MTAELKVLAKSIFPTGILGLCGPRQAQLLFQKFLCACFYKFLFGRQTPLASRLDRRIASWEKRQGKGDIPMSKEAWESDYVGARWGYLDQLEELNRYSVVAGYIQFLKRRGSILDVGCGEGILIQKLSSQAFSKYVGVDISQTAVDKAGDKGNSRIVFVQGDAQTFVPDESFDAIIFNEVLYYLDQPVKVVQRYESWLRPGGVFITSLYEQSTRAVAISNRLKRRYHSIAEVTMCTKSAAWIINIFAAAGSNARNAISTER
ncbi:MAG: class I SAM-dependent methyltransferase [Candidatus Binatia bacterium]